MKKGELSQQAGGILGPCKIEARGQVFEPKMRLLVSTLSLAYKNRIYSPNRILYPLKWVDWNPKRYCAQKAEVNDARIRVERVVADGYEVVEEAE